MKNLLLAIFALIIIGCTCDEISDNNLNAFEQTVIPFDMPINLQFVNEDDEMFSANVSEKMTIFENYSKAEACDDAQNEVQQNNISITGTNINANIIIEKRNAGDTFFQIINGNSTLLPTCEIFTQSAQDLLTNFNSDGFDFQNVFVFEFCEQQNSEIRTIIYSVDNGIEFIKFENDGFLRLVI